MCMCKAFFCVQYRTGIKAYETYLKEEAEDPAKETQRLLPAGNKWVHCTGCCITTTIIIIIIIILLITSACSMLASCYESSSLFGPALDTFFLCTHMF